MSFRLSQASAVRFGTRIVLFQAKAIADQGNLTARAVPGRGQEGLVARGALGVDGQTLNNGGYWPANHDYE